MNDQAVEELNEQQRQEKKRGLQNTKLKMFEIRRLVCAKVERAAMAR